MNRQKKISQDRDNQAYRLSSWNTSQTNISSIHPTIITTTKNTTKKTNKLKSSSKNHNHLKPPLKPPNLIKIHDASSSLYKSRLGLAQSVPNKKSSLVDILKPKHHQQINNKSSLLLSKKPPDKKYYKIVVIRGIMKIEMIKHAGF